MSSQGESAVRDNLGSIEEFDQPITKAEHEALGSHKLGQTLPLPDVIADCTPGESVVGQSTYATPSDHTHSVTLKAISGVPADASFTYPEPGIMAIDTFNNRLYVRMPSGAWKYVNLI